MSSIKCHIDIRRKKTKIADEIKTKNRNILAAHFEYNKEILSLA